METLLIIIFLAVIGVQLGSFAGATVWRLRARQLDEDKAAGEEYDHKEYKHLKKLIGVKVRTDRSRCLHCDHQLAWYDLLPVVSWLQLRGKCRYCRKPIGVFEIGIEIAVALLFVLSYIFWPVDIGSTATIAQFALWLVALIGLVILFVYDAKWFLLPNLVMFPVIAIAAISAIITLAGSNDIVATALSILGSVAALSGLYYLLYVFSRGAWIGFGDIKLGLALGLLLADWRLGLLTLFLANVIGCLIVLPAMLAKKLSRTSHVPFGPMMIAAFVISTLFGMQILTWYMGGLLVI